MSHRRQVLFLDFSLIFNYFYLPYQSSERRALVVISPPTLFLFELFFCLIAGYPRTGRTAPLFQIFICVYVLADMSMIAIEYNNSKFYKRDVLIVIEWFLSSFWYHSNYVLRSFLYSSMNGIQKDWGTTTYAMFLTIKILSLDWWHSFSPTRCRLHDRSFS